MCVSFRAVKNSVVAKLLKHDTRLQRKLTQKNVYDLFMMYSSIHAVCQHQRVCNKSQNKNSFFKNKKRKKSNPELQSDWHSVCVGVWAQCVFLCSRRIVWVLCCFFLLVRLNVTKAPFSSHYLKIAHKVLEYI